MQIAIRNVPRHTAMLSSRPKREAQKAGTQRHPRRLWVPDISLTRNSGMKVLLALQNTVDVPGVGGVRQCCDMRSHVSLGNPAIEGKRLAFAECHIELIRP